LVNKRYGRTLSSVKKLAAGIGITVLCGGLMIGALGVKRNYGTKVSRLEQQVTNHSKTIYIAKENIASGMVIGKSMLEQRTVISDLGLHYFFQDEDLGKLSGVDIEKGCYLLKSMIMEEDIDDSLREEEFGMLHLNSNLKENDFVDVRILYPTGENYTVLSKVRLRELSLEENDCFFWLTEEEILMMHSAIVDTYIHEGTKLYTSKYVKPAVQKASAVNYDPSTQVQQLIYTHPDIVKKASSSLSMARREDMEKRIRKYLKEHPEVENEE
jgi:hypothetical protein